MGLHEDPVCGKRGEDDADEDELLEDMCHGRALVNELPIHVELSDECRCELWLVLLLLF